MKNFLWISVFVLFSASRFAHGADGSDMSLKFRGGVYNDYVVKGVTRSDGSPMATLGSTFEIKKRREGADTLQFDLSIDASYFELGNNEANLEATTRLTIGGLRGYKVDGGIYGYAYHAGIGYTAVSTDLNQRELNSFEFSIGGSIYLPNPLLNVILPPEAQDEEDTDTRNEIMEIGAHVIYSPNYYGGGGETIIPSIFGRAAVLDDLFARIEYGARYSGRGNAFNISDGQYFSLSFEYKSEEFLGFEPIIEFSQIDNEGKDSEGRFIFGLKYRYSLF